MGKKSRQRAKNTTPTVTLDPADLVDVGPREPCPCGSGKRFKQCHGKDLAQAADTFVVRPFEGLPSECDLIAFREIVPSGSVQVELVGENAGTVVNLVTLLPMAMPGLVRDDETIWIGLQTHASSGDPSRDLGHAITAALRTEPGNPIQVGDLMKDGPRLQDLIDTSKPLEIKVHEGFDYWVGENVEDPTGEVAAGLERANAAAAPTVRLESVEAAYWTQIGDRIYLRWVLPYSEDTLLDALARLHAAGSSALIDGSRLIGSFRALGVLAPVWELPAGTSAADVEKPAADFATALEKALATEAPLTTEERAAKAGLASRQLTIR
ncbi:MAG: topoisomerase II [Kribbellaceae bacterium]|nr:topoisomerase II [Kribbellaceae bacterium]